MLDNAKLNNTCVDYILRALYLNFTKKQHNYHCLWCLGYVINLTAQTFLLSKKAEDMIDKLEIAYLWKDFEKITGIWRKQGVLKRLHNIIRYIRIMPQQHEEFRKIKIEGQRWEEFNRLEVRLTNFYIFATADTMIS